MSKVLQAICREENRAFKLYSKKAPSELSVQTFEGSSGVIDFSLPEGTAEICEKARRAKVPYICGTTGWSQKSEIENLFCSSSKEIPIVRDANFSLGVEILCQTAEILARNVPEISITDTHHSQKRDAPSGTALKIEERIKLANPHAKTLIQSIRLGEVFGEHRLLVSFQDQSLEFVHRANSRRPFAEGALKALAWAQQQKPGLYSMKDVLQ